MPDPVSSSTLLPNPLLPRKAANVFVAIDTPNPMAARALAQQLAGHVGGVKLGLEFFCANGPQGVRQAMQDLEQPLFLDLKLHDIPNTVAGAVRSLISLAPTYLTLHGSGGGDMMRAAVDAAGSANGSKPKLLAVSVLTSLSEADLAEVGQAGPVAAQVLRLAHLAKTSGVDGMVCAPGEVSVLRQALGPDFILMVPGIRPSWAAANDQKRAMTPRAASEAGADHLVIGRPITAAADPVAAARLIAEELL